MSYDTTGHPDWPHDKEPSSRCDCCEKPTDAELLTYDDETRWWVCDYCLTAFATLKLQQEDQQ